MKGIKQTLVTALVLSGLLGTSNLLASNLTNLNGDSISFDKLVDAGKPTYIKFWATWCQPCLEQMPHLEKAFKQYNDQINFITVNIWMSENIQDINKYSRTTIYLCLYI